MRQIFLVNVTGIVTARDGFGLDFDKNALLRRIGQFRDLSLTDEFIRHAHKLKDTRGWKLAACRKDLAEVEDWREYVVPCLYRPLDVRSLYYHPYMVDWGHLEVMRHMLAGENLAIIVPRQHKDEFGAFVTTMIGTHKSVAAYDVNCYFPLYLHPTAQPQEKPDAAGRRLVTMMLFEPQAVYGSKKPNLNPAVVAALAAAYGKEPAPEEIFHYIYAVLYAPTYRTKYAESLKMDFPRLPAFRPDAAANQPRGGEARRIVCAPGALFGLRAAQSAHRRIPGRGTG